MHTRIILKEICLKITWGMISRTGSLLFFNGESRMRWLVPIRLLKGDLGDIGEPELRGDNGGVLPAAPDR